MILEKLIQKHFTAEIRIAYSPPPPYIKHIQVYYFHRSQEIQHASKLHWHKINQVKHNFDMPASTYTNYSLDDLLWVTSLRYINNLKFTFHTE